MRAVALKYLKRKDAIMYFHNSDTKINWKDSKTRHIYWSRYPEYFISRSWLFFVIIAKYPSGTVYPNCSDDSNNQNSLGTLKNSYTENLAYVKTWGIFKLKPPLSTYLKQPLVTQFVAQLSYRLKEHSTKRIRINGNGDIWYSLFEPVSIKLNRDSNGFWRGNQNPNHWRGY